MSHPSSRQGLIDYCLKRLGAPVLEINVDIEQLEDRVDDALLYFQEIHYAGTDKEFLKHKITQADINNQYIPIPESIIYVNRIIPLDSSRGGVANHDHLFDLRYHLSIRAAMGGGLGGGSGGLVDFEMRQQYFNLLKDRITTTLQTIDFSRYKNKLKLFINWQKEIFIDQYIIIECFRIVDPSINGSVWNDRFLKDYATSLIKKQWGTNLLKFEGMELPGGVTFSGRQIYDDAVTEIEKLEENAQLNFEAPLNFFFG